MKTTFALAILAGMLCGIFVSHSDRCHRMIASVIRGRAPVAIVHGAGVYAHDAIAGAELNYRAQQEKIPRANIGRELTLLRAQFGEDDHWRAALRANHLWRSQLRSDVADHLRGRVWLDRQLRFAVSDEECRDYFARNQSRFIQPARYRVAHLFLAAPSGTADELAKTKRRTIDELAQRLKNGEQLVDLVARFSEDEATKQRGGDLGWFSDARMSEDFMNAVHALHISEDSGVVQTKLGFHILRLLAVEPSTALSFEEVQAEIANEISNEKRRNAVAKLYVDLASGAHVVHSE